MEVSVIGKGHKRQRAFERLCTFWAGRNVLLVACRFVEHSSDQKTGRRGVLKEWEPVNAQE